MSKPLASLALCLLPSVPALLHADDPRADRRSPSWLLPIPEADLDPAIPALKAVTGHAWAEDVTSHAEAEAYLKALAAAAPDRTRLERYGATYEGRGLYYLVISSAENMKDLERLREGNLRLADPRVSAPDDASRWSEKAPAFVWLAYAVHGNETSSTDAALLTAYHLLADRRPETRAALEKLVVLIDPLQNPDGRERFISVYRESRGAFAEPDPNSSEHAERWPGGRSNHYLFDMNRDWFLQSQVETAAKTAAYLRWQPQIYIDAHEMGRDSYYYFDPPQDPVSELILPRQREWFERLGRNNARWFDGYGFPYTSREMYDAFYPGYGSTWPTMQGGIGILWEQAGVRGLVVARSDDVAIHYHEAVRHHYVSGLSTIETAAANRRELLNDFYQARADAIRAGREGSVRGYFLLEGNTPYRTARLARALTRNGIEVRRLTADARVRASSNDDGDLSERTVAKGSYYLDLAQPSGRLARILLDKHHDMGKDFIRRQLDRLARRLSDEIYDVTAWSLPLAWGITCLSAVDTPAIESEPAPEPAAAGSVTGAPAKLAYLVRGDDDGALFALARWVQDGLAVHVIDQPLAIGGVSFAKGTLLLRAHENPGGLHDAVQAAARDFGIDVRGTDTGFVASGAHLGGPEVHRVRPPKILLVVNRPASYTVGHTWHFFDQVVRYPTTRVSGRSLGDVDLRKYNVLILPDGGYGDVDAPDAELVGRLKEWVREGGTLVLVRGAVAWASGEKVALLATHAETKPPEPESGKSEPGKPEAAPAGPAPGPAAEKRKGEPPDPVPGAFLRASVYDDHWVTFGVRPKIDVLVEGSLVFSALKPTDGRNLVSFLPEAEVLSSGFCWPETLKIVAGKPYVLYQSLGRGHVVAFAGDPCYRALSPVAARLLLNAVFFGPAH